MIGQAINVSVGAAGFVLIMAGRTGWDLTVYAVSASLDLVLSLILLVPKFGESTEPLRAQAIAVGLSNWLRLGLVKRYVGNSRGTSPTRGWRAGGQRARSRCSPPRRCSRQEVAARADRDRAGGRDRVRAGAAAVRADRG